VVLAVDVGTVRVASRVGPAPDPGLAGRDGARAGHARVAELVAEREAVLVVVGLPDVDVGPGAARPPTWRGLGGGLRAAGRAGGGAAGRRAADDGDRRGGAAGVRPVGQKGRAVVDQAAAVALLQGVLDAGEPRLPDLSPRLGLAAVTDLLDLRDERPRPGARKRGGRGKLLAVLFLLLLLAGLVGARLRGGSGSSTGCGAPTRRLQRRGQRRGRRPDRAGDTAGDVADTLVEEGVVASRAAFFEVAASDPRRHRPAARLLPAAAEDERAAAFELLLDPSAASSAG
jgi:putative Holliday junction resolvase